MATPKPDELTVEIKITKGGVLLYQTASPAFLEMTVVGLSFIENEPTIVYDSSQDPYIFQGYYFSPVIIRLK